MPIKRTMQRLWSAQSKADVSTCTPISAARIRLLERDLPSRETRREGVRVKDCCAGQGDQEATR